MATPLTDAINALTTYANSVTGASDTTLSDAVDTLVDGYGGGGGWETEDILLGRAPTGDVVVNSAIPAYGFAGRTGITKIKSNSTYDLTSGAYGIISNNGSFDLYAPNVKNCVNYACTQNPGLIRFSAPSLTGAGANLLRQNQNMTVADLGSIATLNATAMYGCTALKTIILRKSNAVTQLSSTGALQNTPFYTNGSGGTVYCPSALISAYQTATNWSTLYNGGTVTFVALENSAYASTNWIEE